MTDRLSRRAGDFAAGVALLVFPFVTAIVKLIAPGWMALFYLTGLIVFVPLYVLVVVIEAGFALYAGRARRQGLLR